MPKGCIQILLKWDDNIKKKKYEFLLTKKKMPKRCIQTLLKWDDNLI